jgi:uncharacterized protein (DUF849 family)
MPTPFDLMVAPNGARLTQADHPALPITPAEVVAAARACEAAGATSIHAHVRDDTDQHSLDATRYNDLHADLTAATDLRIQVSTEAAGVFNVPAQRACLGAVTARDASVALREIARAPELVAETYAVAAQRGISVQHILYAPEDMEILRAHMDAGILPEGTPRALFVLGRYTPGQVSAPADLDPFLRDMGDLKLMWSVCAFGPGEHDCLLAALNAGGQVRVGFENNRTAPDGRPFQDNAASVAALVEAAAKQGFAPQKADL